MVFAPSQNSSLPNLATYRLGSPRASDQALRIAAVRFLPRGVRKADYARLGYFDVWLPELAPEASLVKKIRTAAATGADCTPHFIRYRRWLVQNPSRRHLLNFLAVCTQRTPLALGCYCEEETKCHRSILLATVREML